MRLSSTIRVIIDRDAYRHNLELVHRMLPADCELMAVVKDDAYGHGLLPLARVATESYVSMLGVATLEEAVTLREEGIEIPILVLIQPPESDLGLAIEHELRVMVSDLATAERLGELAHRANKIALIHCKIDTGMGRQGFELDKAPSELLHITRISHADIEGVATHFPIADSAENPFTLQQIKAFRGVLKQLDKSGIPYEMIHAANSAAIINFPNSVFNMARSGLMTYGVWPTDTMPGQSPLKPLLRWEADVILVKDLESGSSVGYGRTYTTSSRMRAAILPVGYSHGYKHSLSNKATVLIRGKRCPVRGSICMDQIVVDVSEIPEVVTGDTATLIGRDGNEEITVTELAKLANTIPYEILTSVAPRTPREYIN